MTRVLWTEPAVADLEAIRGFVTRDSPVYAEALILQIIGAVERLAAFPHGARDVKHMRRKPWRR
jgi:plasmid stabilization system protein ParE